jgi:hypothetical protein
MPSIGCSLLNDWLLTMVKINSVKNRQFVVYDTGIVYIAVMMGVRQRVVRQSRETRCVVSNCMTCTIQNVCYGYWVLRHLCILDVVGLCSADWYGYFGRCRSMFSRLGRVDLLLRWLWNLVILFVTFKEKSHGRILLARLAHRFRSPWKQTSSEETMERVFCSSDFPIFPLDLLCPIVM